MTAPDRTTPAGSATRVLVRRVLTNHRNNPALPAITLAAPAGMMLLFGFVFGGALAAGQDVVAYRSYLTPGILVLVAATGVVATAVTAAADLRSGLTDRIRALPLAPIAAPAGIAVAETLIGILALGVMAVVGFLSGWRITAEPGEIALAVLLLIGFRFALAWLGVALGATIRDEQVLQQTAPLIFGTIMFSNIFVPTATMPTVLAAVAEWNPVSAVVAALRQLLADAAPAADASLPLRHPIAASAIWIAALLSLAVPAAVRRYSGASPR
ncbi:ABC transporter permease [Nocardia sp. NPDC057227]|uniref:ABC transporter permease n=1 Tax=Nocardia sp. NPDC057227 TaxID=3346056 RepID=UPI00363F237A